MNVGTVLVKNFADQLIRSSIGFQGNLEGASVAWMAFQDSRLDRLDWAPIPFRTGKRIELLFEFENIEEGHKSGIS